MRARLQALWSGLNPRERMLVGIALALTGLLLFWLFVYRPISHYPTSQKRAYERAVLDLKLMKKAQSGLRSGLVNPVRPEQLAPEKFQSVLTRTASENGLSITRRQPKGDREVSLWFEGVNSRTLYVWLQKLTKQYNIRVVRAQISRDDPGGVRAMLTFRLEAKS